VERARKALRGDDMGEIRAAQEELTAAFQAAGQTFYAQQGAGAGGAGGAGGAAGGAGSAGGRPGAEQPAGATAGRADDVVEADYEIVDDDKK
jgi:molecular chaperone DnaK